MGLAERRPPEGRSHLAMNAFRKILLIAILIGILDLSISSFVYGSINLGVMVSQTGTGRIVAATYPPEVTGMRIGTNIARVETGRVYDWVVLVADKNSLSNLQSITIYVYGSIGVRGLFEAQQSYGFRWLRGDVWQELTSAGWSNSTTYLSSIQSTHTEVSPKAGHGEWHFAAKLSEKALQNRSSNHWFFDTQVRDKVGAESRMGISFEVNPNISTTQGGTIQANVPLSLQRVGYGWQELS